MGIVARQSIKGSIISYFGAFIGFITTLVVVVSMVDSQVYGLINVLKESATLLGSLSMAGMGAAGIKFFPYFRNKERFHNGFFYYLFVIPLIGIAVFFSLVLIFKAPIIDYFNKDSELLIDYFYWIFPWAFFVVYQGIFATYSNVLMRIVVPRFVQEVLIRVLNMAILLLFGFGFVNLQWLIGLQVMVYGIAMLVNLFYIARIDKLTLRHDYGYISKPMRKEMFSYAGYTLLAAIGTGIMTKVDTFMVAGTLGLSASGIYSVAMYMGIIVEIPSRSLFAISQPIASEAIKNNDIPTLSKLLKSVSINLMLIGSALFLLIFINADNIFDVIPNGDGYSQGKYVMILIGLAGVINTTFTFSLTLLQLSKHYIYYLPFLLILSALGIGSNYLLIPLFDINGAALSKVITYVVFGLLLTLFVYYKLHIHPLTWSHAKLLGIIIGVISINFLLPEIQNAFLDALYRTSIIGIVGITAVYYFKISPDANRIGEKLIASFFKRNN